MDKVSEILAGLREERDRLSAELAEVERAIAALEGTAQAKGATMKAGPYTAMTLHEAAASYLASAGEPKTSGEIARALLAGGFVTHAKYFTGVVSTMLLREDATHAWRIRRTKNKRRWFVTQQAAEE